MQRYTKASKQNTITNTLILTAREKPKNTHHALKNNKYLFISFARAIFVDQTHGADRL